MLAAFCLVSLVGVISFTKENPTQKEIEAAADLTISNFSQLKSFAEAVKGENDYAGKTVLLMKDIDCGGEDFPGIGVGTTVLNSKPFCGTFDGQGFEIKNYKITGCYTDISYSSSSTNKGGSTTYYRNYSALFINIGASAQINNLKVSGYQSGITQQSSTTTGKHKVYRYYYCSPLVSNCDTGGQVNECYINGSSPTGVTVNNSLILDGGTSRVSGTNLYGNLNNLPPSTSGICSSKGGDGNGKWYYGGSTYHYGWPIPRVFIKNWTTINFSANPNNGGTITGETIENSTIQVPSGAPTPTINTTEATISILEQVVTAQANYGYKLANPCWTGSGTSYTANFERNSHNLQFNNTTGDYIKSPDSSQTSFMVRHGTLVKAAFTDDILTYSFKIDDKSYEVQYTIPEKYGVSEESLITVEVVDATEIIPILILKKYGVDYNGEGGSWGEWTSLASVTSASTEQIEHGTIIEYNVETSKITLTMNGKQKVFTANEGYEIEYLQIITESSNETYEPGKSGSIPITEKVEFYAYARKLYYVTFADALDDNFNTGVAILNTEYVSTNSLKIKQGDDITGEYKAETGVLTYTYQNENVATYEGVEFYAILFDPDKDEIKDVSGDDTNLTIQPIFRFYACKVTMGDIDSNLGTREIEYRNENIQDNSFVVEFGTLVTLSISNSTDGIYTYIYTFKHKGQEVAKVIYKMRESKYVMQYVLNPTTGERMSMVNGLNGDLEGDSHIFNAPENVEDLSIVYTQKEILPKFGLRQTWGNLA